MPDVDIEEGLLPLQDLPELLSMEQSVQQNPKNGEHFQGFYKHVIVLNY